MDLPVTLVIKAPNQRVDDHHVECMMDWTVKKLKQHLTDVYPSKPLETQQKLIYSGKLLADHLTLKEVLRSFDDGSNKHTVHLVCSFPQEFPSSMSSQSHSRQSSASSNSSSASVSDTGLRYRGSSPTSMQSPQPDLNTSGHMFSPNSGQMQAGFPAEAAMMYSGMNPAAGMGYSPEQYMWMQQMYQQYMTQYMQYYQQAGYLVPPNPTQTHDGAQPQNQADNRGREPAAAVAGAVMDDDVDDEFGQRDWLDYVYVFSRCMVLLGIVYFYSSLSRFLMVSVFFVLVYAYQMGWFGFLGLQRRQQQRQQQQQQQGQQQQQEQQDQQQQNEQQHQNINEPIPNGDSQSQTDTPVEPQPIQAGPGALQILWTFISTFFTSLMPAPPPPVNAN